MQCALIFTFVVVAVAPFIGIWRGHVWAKSNGKLLAQRRSASPGKRHTFSDEALDLMIQYDWPGNKRELENAIRRAVALSSGPVLEVADLPPELQSFRACSEDAELTADMSETRRAP